MTSSSGDTGARDQSRVHPEGLVNKVLQTVWREADKNRQIFAGKIGQRPLRVTSSSLKKVELCCHVKGKEIFVQICRR